jgi:hypothetical protein
MKTIEEMLDKARTAKRESKYVEFKTELDVNSLGARIEFIKDFVAMANTGYGIILIGVKNDGTPSGFDTSAVLKYDPAKLTDQIAKYTGVQFSDFEIREIKKRRSRIAVFLIFGVSIPMVFIRPGTYTVDNKEKSGFSKGTVYFRHGAKSEPGDSNDIRDVIERELKNIRESWLGNIKRVVTAPSNSEVRVITSEQGQRIRSNAKTIRIVNDSDAPGYRLDKPDKFYPYRQKEVIEQVNKKLAGRRKINSHDVLCIRTIYKINERSPEYCFVSEFGPKQYSEAFVDWIIGRYEDDAKFFEKARKAYKKRVKKARGKA